MGLLDSFLGSSMDDPRTAIALSIGQGLLSAQRPMQGLNAGLLSGMQAAQQMKQQKAAEEYRQLQMQQAKLGVEQGTMQLDQMRQQLARQAAIRNDLASLEGGGSAAPAPVPAAQTQSMAFTPEYNQVRAERAQTAGVPAQAQPGGLTDNLTQRLVTQAGVYAKNGDFETANKLYEQAAKFLPEVKEISVSMRNGQPVNVITYKNGKQEVSGFAPTPKLHFADTGGTILPVDEYTGRPVNTGLRKTMTPDAIASNKLGQDRLNFDQEQAKNTLTYQQDADGNFVGLPTRGAPGMPVQAIPVIAPGGSPLQGKGAGMTEDQSKATGWLVQAENAFKNMKAAGFDKKGNPRSAAFPGVADVVEKTPIIEGAANYLRSADRQKFIQAASSFSEALLRAATGAGVNHDEAVQKVKELTPQFGEDPETTRQKMKSGELYLQSLRVRAGPGARKADSIFNPNGGGGGGGGDPLGLRGRPDFDPNDPFGLRDILNPGR